MKLVWPIRRSFVEYVEQLDGAISVSPEVQRTPEGFVFPGDGLSGGRFRFTGSVSFTAHDGMLDLTVRDPELIAGADPAGMLLVTLGVTQESIATVEIPEDASVAFTARPVLTSRGARLFGGGYQPGDSLDDFEVREIGAS